MVARGVAGIAGVAAVAMLACGLELEGLEDAPDAGAPDSSVSEDTGPDVPTYDYGPIPSPDAGADADADAADVLTTEDAPAEAGSDAPPPVDGACGGVTCQGKCTTDTTCVSCTGAPLLCPGTSTCTADCTACPSSPVQCFTCDSQGNNPVGTCEPDDAGGYCLDGDYQHCGCTLSSDCPGTTLSCFAIGTGTQPFQCYTCGEQLTDGDLCNGGGRCDQATASCP